jgi:hypothetical protein
VDDRAPASRAVFDSARGTLYVSLVDRLVSRLEREAGFQVVRMSTSPSEESVRRIRFDSTAVAAVPADTMPSSTWVRVTAVDSSYFDLFGVRRLAGRTFASADHAAGASAVLVNQSFVRHYFGDANALGRGLRFAPEEQSGSSAAPDASPRLEIVGVVADFPPLIDPGALLPRVYLPLRPLEVDPIWLAVRAPDLSAVAAADRIRAVALTVDPAIRFRPIRAMDDLMAEALRVQQLALLGLVAVAVSVLLLSAASIYALTAFTVARRRREIGIRCALGARPGRVLTGVLSGAMRQVGLGIVIGTIVTGILALVARDYASLLDALALVGQLLVTGLMMALVGLAATLGPARRALRVPPTEALKAE